MNYEEAAKKYLEAREALEALERSHKAAKAAINETVQQLEGWFANRAQEDGIEKVHTSLGLAYWSTHNTATVASREAFFSFCKEQDSWDMLESRASKTGVKSYIEAHGEPPPGVDFTSYRVFNFRKAKPTE